jgi:hypothetical protein
VRRVADQVLEETMPAEFRLGLARREAALKSSAVVVE